MYSMLIQNKKFDLEHEKMTTPTDRLATASICGRSSFEATPTTRLKTGSICGRSSFEATPTGDLMTTSKYGGLPFDVSDDNTKEAVNQEVKLDFLNVLKFSK